MNVKQGDLAFIINGPNRGHIVTVVELAQLAVLDAIWGPCWVIRASGNTLSATNLTVLSDGSVTRADQVLHECIAPDFVLRPIHGDRDAIERETSDDQPTAEVA